MPKPSTSAAFDGPYDAVLHDGENARAWSARVHFAGNALEIALTEDRRIERISAPAIGLLEQRPGRIMFGRRDNPGWRLILSECPPDAVLAPFKRRNPRQSWHRSRPGLIVALVIASVFVISGLVFGEKVIARLIPDSATARMGEAVVTYVKGSARTCDEPAGLRALDSLARKLWPDTADRRRPRIAIIDRGIVNALAAPGGRIVLFKGLIDDTQNPAELAGILAHEMGHVRRRHALRGQIRAIGLGALLRAMGGDMGSIAEGAAFLSFSRSMEREADSLAAESLRRAGAAPAALAGFFERMAAKQSESEDGMADYLSYLSTHPAPRDRAARLDHAAPPAETVVLLTQTQWQSIKSLCNSATE